MGSCPLRRGQRSVVAITPPDADSLPRLTVVCATRRAARRVNDHPARLLANPRLSLLEAAMSDRRSRSESLSTAPVGTKLAAFASIGKPVEKPALTHIQSKWKPLATSATIGNYARHHCPRRHRHRIPHPRRRHPRLIHHSSSLHRHPHHLHPSPPPPLTHHPLRLHPRLLYPRHHRLLHLRRRAFDKNAAGLPAARSVTDLP